MPRYDCLIGKPALDSQGRAYNTLIREHYVEAVDEARALQKLHAIPGVKELLESEDLRVVCFLAAKQN
jgi:hypothetical protein